ncbi:two-component sensor histidine kinase [Rhodoplanes elegans]|uniref:Signal transduction histidine-protein kinase/phosphatase MprB n=1 Tax=Rhodoplanes elegans TaxID=29408 RepID=A0A327KTG0_9BRAD|nr:ATP-binding protein [Rhodoplanes elegans]MBK5959274.1 two-component sensor histidine kinase [Rhodoplanes elegans]RAI42200.1 two-component sensor histidine kinase [Rhodoplanes elegans]
MRRDRLSRQITLSMSIVAAIAVLMAFVGTFIFYGIYLTWFPPPPGPPSLLPEAPDFVLIAVFLLLGLAIAIHAALRLTRRILAPLNSLAEGARKIAAGDLTARAVAGDRSLGETAQLVDDFNVMAQRLQDVAKSMTSWNATIAHELRTPLTILRGRLQGLTDGVFEPSDELFRSLLAQVESLSRLVDDLRIVTLSDTLRLDVRIEPVDLVAEVSQAVDAMRPALIDAGFSVQLTTSPVTLSCDGVRIRQALLALLENARRYARPGRLEVVLHPEDAAVVLSVEDEGPGLSVEFAARAFDAFARAEPSRSRQFGGSGLGLSVVRAIAEAHGGQAQYRRSSTGGSVFEIVLPVRNPDVGSVRVSSSVGYTSRIGPTPS